MLRTPCLRPIIPSATVSQGNTPGCMIVARDACCVFGHALGFCASGFQLNAVSGECEACDVGFFKDNNDADSGGRFGNCVPCSNGLVTNATGSTAAADCDAGTLEICTIERSLTSRMTSSCSSKLREGFIPRDLFEHLPALPPRLLPTRQQPDIVLAVSQWNDHGRRRRSERVGLRK